MSAEVPRTFRRESRFFLWIALLLILFLNLLTLLVFRSAVAWGGDATERRAAEALRRVSLAAGPEGPMDTMEKAAVEPDVVFIASYDERGRRIHSFGQDFTAPALLQTSRPRSGAILHEWRRDPALLLSTLGHPRGFYSLALDPGPGATLKAAERTLTIILPLAAAALVVLAGLFLRSLLSPYDRLLAAAGAAPGAASAHQDERDFVIARFESTIAALSEKERELARLARAEKERADDLETAARTLSRNLPTGLLSVDAGGVVLELNESGREILRLSRDVRGGDYDTALAGVPGFRETVARALRDREAIGRREVEWRSGGEELVLGVTATPAVGREGRFLGAIALFSDLTEVRRLEARVALARHLADLGEVSSGAAHEFRNAAAAIDGFADLALRSPERAGEYLRRIRREAQEMSRVTSDFLLFARPEKFSPETVDLSEVAREAAGETESVFADAPVLLSGEFPKISGSTVLLRRALANLLRNAVEATPRQRRSESGAITLTGEAGEEEVLLCVGDRGEGVAPARREKIFLPFYSTKPAGAGFGLAIVARIAELHGGTVEVAGRPGGGALFTLRLPVLPARAAPFPLPPQESS